MKKIIVTLVISVVFANLYGQTYFEGGIYNDAEWTLENSPYIITGDVVLFPGKTLTIQPGVEVKFDGFYFLEIRGELIAIGNSTDRIVFTSNLEQPDKDDWIGTIINNNAEASASFEYCEFSFAEIANNVYCCWGGGLIYFRNCKFSTNTIALNGYTGNMITVDSCEFTYNTYAVDGADKIISNSIFIANEYGLYATSRISVHKSIFRNNNVALCGDRELVDSCIIENNNIGVKTTSESFELRDNQIVNNTIGVQLSNYDGLYRPIKNNLICNNSTYNVENLVDENRDLTGNCWCSTDSTTIENLIYDGYDNIYYGLVNYDIYEEDCQTLFRSVIKVDLGLNVSNSNSSKLVVYPNPADEMIEIFGITNLKQVDIYDISGKLLMSETETPIMISDLQKGVYILRIIDVNGFAIIEKIVKN